MNDSKVATVTPENPVADFNERYIIKTQLEFDPVAKLFKGKKSSLSLQSKDMATIFGEVEFDIAKYVNAKKPCYDEVLPLEDCQQDPQASISIFLQASILPTQSGANSSKHKSNKYGGEQKSSMQLSSTN